MRVITIANMEQNILCESTSQKFETHETKKYVK